jgi:hypothetical protein
MRQLYTDIHLTDVFTSFPRPPRLNAFIVLQLNPHTFSSFPYYRVFLQVDALFFLRAVQFTRFCAEKTIRIC